MTTTIKTFHGETAYIALSGTLEPATDVTRLTTLVAALAASDYVWIAIDVTGLTRIDVATLARMVRTISDLASSKATLVQSSTLMASLAELCRIQRWEVSCVQ
jgi:ABC-type transporter Mla MlaB component